MTPFPEQLRAFMPASPGIEAEATRGSPEDYDDRMATYPTFLVLAATSAQGHGRACSGRANAEGKAI
jgi:hypothetical protein